ncbi:MAG: hypothetical protein K8E66_13235, partial [Phycisphaerales bacterium]|nr:hypothetical protein [Phycisphaerales bacterium]
MTRHVWMVLLIGVLVMTGSVHAGGGPPEGFIYQSIKVDGREYPYVVFRPRGLDAADSASRPTRGLVFLHGRGECGTDGSHQLAVGLPPALVWDTDRWPFV